MTSLWKPSIDKSTDQFLSIDYTGYSDSLFCVIFRIMSGFEARFPIPSPPPIAGAPADTVNNNIHPDDQTQPTLARIELYFI